VQTFVQQDDVRVGAGAKGTLFELDTQQSGGICRQHPNRIRQRGAQADDIA